jgi:hypothetical protein
MEIEDISIKLDKALKLLQEASEVLGCYWFRSDGEDEWNNDDIIEINEKIDIFLKEVTRSPND